MSEMIKYEWKKIWKSRLAQLVIIGCGLFLVFCVWASIMQISATMKKVKIFGNECCRSDEEYAEENRINTGKR